MDDQAIKAIKTLLSEYKSLYAFLGQRGLGTSRINEIFFKIVAAAVHGDINKAVTDQTLQEMMDAIKQDLP